MRLKRLAGVLSWVILPLLLTTTACQAAQVHPARPAKPTRQTCATNQTGIIPVHSAGGHVYEFEADEYNSRVPYTVCTNGSTGFTVQNSSLDIPLGGAPGAYASQYRGNHGYLAPVPPESGLPVPVGQFTTGGDPVRLSLSATPPSSGVWDLDFDTFFTPVNASRPGPQTEIMIWLDSAGVNPAGPELAKDVELDGLFWNIYGEWTSTNPRMSLVSYQLAPPRASVTSLDYTPFVQRTISAGFLPSGWTLADVEAGYEIWQGGTGAQVGSWSVCDPAGC
ncbi:MAG TPA: hypothetical protein VGH27_34430 [Streptosporangiaceae bacterium]|jgi:cellulose 1,4-beta-cellobiosidase